MQSRNIILAASSAGLILAVVLLFVQVRTNPPAEIPEQAVEQARQRHERRSQGSRMRESQAESSSPSARPRVTREQSARSEDRPERPSSRSFERPNLPRESSFSNEAADPDSKGTDLDTRMAAANQLYDRRDYEGALVLAKELLQESPGNVRMLRVVVSSSCLMGDEQTAREHNKQLPKRHQTQMQRRCERYDIDLGVSE